MLSRFYKINDRLCNSGHFPTPVPIVVLIKQYNGLSGLVVSTTTFKLDTEFESRTVHGHFSDFSHTLLIPVLNMHWTECNKTMRCLVTDSSTNSAPMILESNMQTHIAGPK